MALTDKLSAIGSAIREKTGKSDLLTLDAMPAEIAAIETSSEPVIDHTHEDERITAKSMGDYVNDRVTTVGNGGMASFNSANYGISFPNVITADQNSFNDTKCVYLSLPNCESCGTKAFYSAGQTNQMGSRLYAPNLADANGSNVTYLFQTCEFNYVKLPKWTTTYSYMFHSANSLVISLPEATTMQGNGPFQSSKAQVIFLPKATSLSSGNTFSSTTLVSLNLPSLTTLTDNSWFNSSSKIQQVDLGVCSSIKNTSYTGFPATIHTIVLRYDGVCSLATAASTLFKSTKIVNGKTGYIYVPAAHLESYKAATNWSTVADQFRAIEDYPSETTFGVIYSEDTAAIEYGTYNGNTNITGAYLPNCTGIYAYGSTQGAGAFSSCTNLYYIDAPKATAIGGCSGCTNLIAVEVPEVTSIAQYAFHDCDNLKFLDLPKVTRIDMNAFYLSGMCSSSAVLILRNSAVVEASLSPFSSSSMSSTSYPKVYVPAALVEDYKAHTHWGKCKIYAIEGSPYEEV